MMQSKKSKNAKRKEARQAKRIAKQKMMQGIRDPEPMTFKEFCYAFFVLVRAIFSLK